MKKLLSVFLCLWLCVGLLPTAALATQTDGMPPVLAAPSTESAAQEDSLFPRVNTYTFFHDVRDHWAEANIRICVETGLMVGIGDDFFAPDVQLTVAEVATIAARLKAAIEGQTIPEAGENSPWYSRYVDYLTGYGITVGSPTAYVTRYGFFSMLAKVIPYRLLSPVNNITVLPDTRDTEILRFYNAGILTGVDEYGTFHGSDPLTRSQCAAMVSRIVEPSLRCHFTPAGQVPAGALSAETLLFTVNTAPVTYDEYEDALLDLAREVQSMYLTMGLEFTWEGSYGEDWATYFTSATVHALISGHLAELKAAELGCTPDELASNLFPPPTEEELLHAAQIHRLDLSAPDQHDKAVQIILDEKLNAQLSLWVDEARIEYFPAYETLDPVAICRDQLQHAPFDLSILTTNS